MNLKEQFDNLKEGLLVIWDGLLVVAKTLINIGRIIYTVQIKKRPQSEVKLFVFTVDEDDIDIPKPVDDINDSTSEESVDVDCVEQSLPVTKSEGILDEVESASMSDLEESRPVSSTLSKVRERRSAVDS